MEQNKNINPDEVLGKGVNFKSDSDKDYQLLGGAAILGMTGLSAVVAGLVTSHVAKKRTQELLRELGKGPPPVLLENPISLAFRALAWGTVWAVGGVSLITFGVWKYCGFKDLEDLRTRSRKLIHTSPPDESTEFKTVGELLNYLNEESAKKKKKGT